MSAAVLSGTLSCSLRILLWTPFQKDLNNGIQHTLLTEG